MNKNSCLLIIFLILSVMANLYQYYLLNITNIETLALQNEYTELESQYENLRKPSLHRINFGFSSGSISGIIFNSGVDTAYNVKIILSCEAWSYTIDVANIEGGYYEDFSKSVSVPEEYKYRTILAGLEWTETP